MMTPLSPEKYTVAWFTLAAFIARKEKERALGIYRLLTHSLHNEALAYQLEGDILLSFSDEKALSAYEKAAAFYEKQGALVQAAAVYEHLVTLVPDYLDYAHKLVRLYISQSLNTQANAYISPHVRRALTHLATLYSNSLQRALSVGTSDQVELMIQEGIAPLVYDQHKAFVYAHIALSMSTNSIFINTAQAYTARAVRYFSKLADSAQLDIFLEQLLEHNQFLYNYAHECSADFLESK